MTLDAELRYTLAGGGVIHLRGWAERARTLAAVWYMLDDFTRISFTRASIACGKGPPAARRLFALPKRARHVNFEFVAQYLAVRSEAPIP
jgi:hypothetical protein